VEQMKREISRVR